MSWGSFISDIKRPLRALLGYIHKYLPIHTLYIHTHTNLLWSSSQSVISVAQGLTLRPHGLQHARLLCPLPTPGACSDSCPLSCWCHWTISSSNNTFSTIQTVLFKQIKQYFPNLLGHIHLFFQVKYFVCGQSFMKQNLKFRHQI